MDDESNASDTLTPEPDENPAEGNTDTNADVFPRSYVEELRQENGKHRQRADAYAQRLHAELVRATGLLADPTDLPFDGDHLDDPDMLRSAIEDLVAKHPRMAAQRLPQDMGQSRATHTPSQPTDFSGLLFK